MNKFWYKYGVYFKIVISLAIVFFIFKPNPKDDTDNPNGGRSNMALYIDHRTGCHYLSTGWPSTLVLRLDENGKHICEGDGDGR